MVSLRRAGGLETLGRMAPAGLKAFSLADRRTAGHYSYERRTAKLVSAKKPETRSRCLPTLIEASAHSRRVDVLARPHDPWPGPRDG